MHHLFRRRSSFATCEGAATLRRKAASREGQHLHRGGGWRRRGGCRLPDEEGRRACERWAVRLGTAAVRGVLTTRQRSRRALDVRSRAAVDRAWRRPERGLPVGGGLRPYRADGSARPGRGRLQGVAKGRCGSRRINTGSSSRGSCSKRAPTPTTTRDSTTACNNRTTTT